jgi:hypothetical protein
MEAGKRGSGEARHAKESSDGKTGKSIKIISEI